MFGFLFLTYFTVYCYRGSRFIHTLELTSNELLFMADSLTIKWVPFLKWDPLYGWLLSGKNSWRGYEEEGTLLHCWWECKWIQTLWRTAWRFLKTVGIKLPCMRVELLQLYLTFCNPMTVACQAPRFMGFSRQDPGVDCHALLQGIFPTQGLNLHHLCLCIGRKFLYH